MKMCSIFRSQTLALMVFVSNSTIDSIFSDLFFTLFLCQRGSKVATSLLTSPLILGHALSFMKDQLCIPQGEVDEIGRAVKCECWVEPVCSKVKQKKNQAKTTVLDLDSFQPTHIQVCFYMLCVRILPLAEAAGIKPIRD